jgi:hypothetical protein
VPRALRRDTLDGPVNDECGPAIEAFRKQHHIAEQVSANPRRPSEDDMAEAAAKLGTMTIGEFDRFVEDAPEGVEYELVDGTPMLMGNPTQVHEQIVSNIVAPLHTAMKPKGCSAFAGNMRVQAPDDSSSKNKFKPDVMVRCGPISYEQRARSRSRCSLLFRSSCCREQTRRQQRCPPRTGADRGQTVLPRRGICAAPRCDCD